MFDVYKFIECVQEYPAIWDNTSKEYLNKPGKEACWNNVAEDVFPNWLEMTSEQRENQMKEIKNKWRHIRDSYMKFTKQNRSSAKRRKYVYAKSLKFLENYVPARRSYYKATDKEEEENEDNVNSEEQQVQKFEEVLMDTPDDDEEFEEESMQPESPRPLESHLPSMHQQSPTKQKVVKEQTILGGHQEEVADADRSFLLSILADYKMLSYEEKLDFRMYALGFFKRTNVQKSQIKLQNSRTNHQ